MKQISAIKEELITEHGNEYFEIFINYLQNFEDIINNKTARKRRKKIKSRFKLLINEKIK